MPSPRASSSNEDALSGAPSVPLPAHRAFTAFAHRDFRLYSCGALAAMMADNIEHVISYWVLFQRFHSPALGGFAVVSHWVPYLLLGGVAGGLADRFDIRRLIQAGMLLYIGVSLTWGVLFATHAVSLGMAMALLVVHGLAGVVWLPASQVLIHQIVPPEALPSAVRLNATGRYVGLLVGPAVGGFLLLTLGPIYGIWANALFYLPLFLWLMRVPYGAAAAQRPAVRSAVRGFADISSAVRVVASHRVLLSMSVLVGAASFFVGNAYQAQMPEFARDLGHLRADFYYSMLLAADAAGGLVGGIILESRGLLPPRARTAYVLAMLWCAALIGFARAGSYGAAIALLFVAGFMQLSFNSMAQALVQINAPAAMRGRVIGVFSMAALGFRTFSGVSVGLLGARIGIHRSLALSAGALFFVCALLFIMRHRRRS